MFWLQQLLPQVDQHQQSVLINGTQEDHSTHTVLQRIHSSALMPT
jgi:hypothetical protein